LPFAISGRPRRTWATAPRTCPDCRKRPLNPRTASGNQCLQRRDVRIAREPRSIRASSIGHPRRGARDRRCTDMPITGAKIRCAPASHDERPRSAEMPNSFVYGEHRARNLIRRAIKQRTTTRPFSVADHPPGTMMPTVMPLLNDTSPYMSRRRIADGFTRWRISYRPNLRNTLTRQGRTTDARCHVFSNRNGSQKSFIRHPR